MDNNINVLDELNKGCCMGIDAIEIIIKKVNEYEFRELLEEFKEKYSNLSTEIKDLYKEFTEDDIHKTNNMTKLMTWYGIQKDTILDDSISNLADLLIRGTNMGIIEGEKIINNKKVDKNIKNITEKYIKMQKKYIEKLEQYL